MHHASVTLGHDWLVLKKIKDFELSLENLGDGHHAVTMAENESALYLIIICYIYLNLNVFARFSISYGFTLSVFELQNLGWGSAWHNSELFTKPDSSTLDFTVGNERWVLHLVQNRDSQWSILVSLVELHIVEDLKESWSLVPVGLALERLSDIVSSKTGNWHPYDVLVFVATLVEEWLETLLDLIIS